jgi:PKD repeat protein
MSFLYTSPLNHAIFKIEPESPAYSTLTDAGNLPKNFEIAYDGSDYKTIGTFLGFSDLAGGAYPSSQKNLMKHYLEFFGLNLTGPFPFFHAASTNVCTGRTLGFTDDSFDHITSWNWEFQGGTPASSTMENPSVLYDSTGKFDVKLTVSDGTHVKSILKKGYITVGQCSGNEELSIQPLFRVFPNPANDHVTIVAARELLGTYRLTLRDIAGRRILERKSGTGTGEGTITLDLTAYKPGLYFLSIRSGNSFATQKLIIY